MPEKIIYYEPEDMHTVILGTTRSGKSRKYKPADICGPEAAGSCQHGTSCLMTPKEKDKSCGVWITNESLNSAGIIFGKENEDA